MGDDTKAFLRKLLQDGFEEYNKRDFGVIHTKRHTKVYWKGNMVKAFSSSPGGTRRGIHNAKSQLRKGIQMAEAREEATK